MTISYHIARRGIEVAHGALSKPEDGPGEIHEIKMSPIAAIIFTLTILAFLAVMFIISYTFSNVIPTLCMVESPETTAYVPVDVIEPSQPPAYTPTPKTPGQPDDDEDEEYNQGSDPELLLIQNKPITSSLRASVAHLRARSGFRSLFRGLSIFLIANFAGGVIASPFMSSKGPSSWFFMALGAIIAEVVLARWHMTWIHIVISEPSPKPWYRRVPAWNTWPKIAPAVAVWAVTNQIVSLLPLLITGSFGSLNNLRHNPDYEPSTKDLYALGGQGMMGFFIMIALFVLLQIPATVTLVRVAASMLPEEDETIVSFDRTFGGKTTPTILGGQGKIGMIEAWRSFPWASRVRLVKLMIKVVLLMIATWFVGIVVLVAQAHIFFGDQFGEIMRKMHRHHHGIDA